MQELTPGELLPTHDSYASDAQARSFWRASFRAGRRYPDSKDANGDPVLIQHAREDSTDYRLRKRTTPVRDYTGAIIRRYNDFVFRRSPHIEPGSQADFVDDVDGRGTSAVDFFRARLKVAQVDGVAFILAQGTVPGAQTMTVAQAQAAGARQVLVPVSADAVFDWDRAGGVLSAARVLFDGFAMEYDSRGQRRRLEIKKAGAWWMLESIGQWERTGYPTLPIVDLWPSFDDLDSGDDWGHGESQASPIAECQRAIYNISSLLSAEMYDNTFTQHVLFGADQSQFDAGNQNEPNKKGPAVDWSTKRLLCIPESAGKLEKAGSDVAQADSLRTTIAGYEDTLYAAAGISGNNAITQAQSGIALAFRNNDLSAILSSLAGAVESAFGRTMALVAQGAEPAAIAMSDDYDPGDFASELTSVISAMVTPALPATFKRQIAKRFATRHFPDLPEDAKMELEGEIDAIDGMGLATQSFARGIAGA